MFIVYGMAGLLTLILAESALETIPQSLWNHPVIKSFSERKGKHPKFIILDRSYHHYAMKNLEDGNKRGRPDIIHFSLLEALGSPLNKEGLLRIYVHTINDYVISVSPETRLPKNLNRFVGLIEALFEYGRVPPKGKPLLTLETKTLPALVDELKPTYIVVFDKPGERKTFEEMALTLSGHERPLVIVGGFPHGEFNKATLRLADEVVCVDPETLETWTVVSRIIYEYERAISLPEKRLERLR
ncbi:MAG: 16S rRNA methyltransferase [Candidatus Bathyarchaeota archaeon]|nr:16S rRNA methyltransferase [Candidatus Bathyarchaeota archaeon]